MDKTSVRCEIANCGEPATHKIAAPWNDARFSELKTYGFACPEHVEEICHKAEVRWLDYEPVAGERVGAVSIYRYEAGKSDREFMRDREMEESFLTCPPPF